MPWPPSLAIAPPCMRNYYFLPLFGSAILPWDSASARSLPPSALASFSWWTNLWKVVSWLGFLPLLRLCSNWIIGLVNHAWVLPEGFQSVSIIPQLILMEPRCFVLFPHIFLHMPSIPFEDLYAYFWIQIFYHFAVYLFNFLYKITKI